MIVYNVTVKISHEKHDDWVEWMKEVHIPDVMATKLFTKNVFSKVLVDDEEGVNYSIQYYCESLEVLDQYQEIFAPKLQAEHSVRYKDHFVAFRTLLELV